MSKSPGTRLLSRIAVLAAAAALALPISAQARGGGGGGGHGGGGGFHGGGFGIMRGAGAGVFHGGFAFVPQSRFRAERRFGVLPERRFHDGVAFRLGRPGRSHSGLAFVPGAPLLRGRAVPPLNGVAVPPFQGSSGFRGPEIWRRGQNGTWQHQLGFRDGGRLSPGAIGFGLVLPAFGVPLVYDSYGAEAYGATCNAAPYVCPIDPAAPVGTSCACPVEDGQLAPGWVE